MALTLQLCPSPDLIGCYAQQDWDSTLVVITDVFRASATILSALYHGAIEVRPVATIEESLQHQNDPDYLVAAERNARRVEGATLGNDPEEYTRDRVEGKRVVLTTTNGTRALHLAQEAGAKHIAVGTFGNISCLSEYILQKYTCGGSRMEGAACRRRLSFCRSLTAPYRGAKCRCKGNQRCPTDGGDFFPKI